MGIRESVSKEDTWIQSGLRLHWSLNYSLFICFLFICLLIVHAVTRTCVCFMVRGHLIYDYIQICESFLFFHSVGPTGWRKVIKFGGNSLTPWASQNWLYPWLWCWFLTHSTFSLMGSVPFLDIGKKIQYQGQSHGSKVTYLVPHLPC